jgi:acetolactate synthase-1/2/3 large subunit
MVVTQSFTQDPGSTPRVVDYLTKQLVAAGVRHIFGVDGANIEDLYDAAHFTPGITAVLAKHEFSAAAMADGYSRSGHGLGVVATTSGGGCLNAVAGLGESYASRVPVLALIGQPLLALDGQGSFQDTSGHNGAVDAEALFSAVSVFCARLRSPAEAMDVLPRAIAAAQAGGPAVLLLPKDIQQSPIHVPASPCHRNGAHPRASDDPQMVVRALRGADGPVMIIAGEQVARDDARSELEELRAALRARVACVPDAKDVAGTPGRGSSAALGLAGIMGHPGVSGAIADSALCLLVGTRLPLTARGGLEQALASTRVVSIGAAAPFIACTHVHSEDLRVTLTRIREALTGAARPRRTRLHAEMRRTELSPPPHTGPGVRYKTAMAALDTALPGDVDIVVDAGNTGAAAIHYLPARRDGRFVVALGMGGMGYSFGAAIGVAFARGRRTVVIAGDGAFYMHGMELHTAIEHHLPITCVLFNNNAHAMCVTREQLFYRDLYSYNRFRPAHLGAGLAAMFPGLHAVDVAGESDFEQALNSALAVEGPSVVSVECSADEIPPFAPFLVSTAGTTHAGRTTPEKEIPHGPARP